MAETYTISPGNDISWTMKLKEANTTTGKVVPLTTGTVTAFIATTNGPTATAANAALSVTCTYTGTNSGLYGLWTVAFSGTASLTYAILNPLFGSSGTPYLIITQTTPTAFRRTFTLVYAANEDGIAA